MLYTNVIQIQTVYRKYQFEHKLIENCSLPKFTSLILLFTCVCMAYLFLLLYIIIFCIIKYNLKCCETAKSAKLNIMRQKVPIPDKNLFGTTWNTFCSGDTNILCSNLTSFSYEIYFFCCRFLPTLLPREVLT